MPNHITNINLKKTRDNNANTCKKHKFYKAFNFLTIDHTVDVKNI